MTFPGIAPHALSERDFEPVKDLIEEVRRRENLTKAFVTWQNAFTIFKKLERRNGLPNSQRERTVYLAIVSELRSAGYWLRECVEAHQAKASETMHDAGISTASLDACLAQLEIDDRAVFLVEDPDLVKRLEANLG